MKIEWNIIINYQASFKKKGQTLAVIMNEESPGKFTAIAVETPSDMKTIDDVFGNHFHAKICEKLSRRNANAAVKVFAKKWAESPEISSPCECSEIEA